MIQPPVWNRDELESASLQAEEHFRSERHTEPLETYLALFDEYRSVVAEVLERTADLTRLNEQHCQFCLIPHSVKCSVILLALRFQKTTLKY